MPAGPVLAPYSPTTYTRLFQLGAGGMGTVHLALARRQPEFQRLVVVKTLPGTGKGSVDAKAMLVEEARLSARLNHPNVVQVTEIVELEDSIMLVMEYLDGFCLSDAFREAGAAFSLPYRLRAICEVLAGLHYAHELTDHDGTSLGIVHRDVSPPNIFVTYDGRVKLLDFGIAKAGDSPHETKEGIIKGRIAYMPVEQFAGQKLDRRADIYAMGSILFEAISNKRLWDGCSRKERLNGLTTGVVPKLDPSLNVDPALRAIVEKAMQPARENRYATAEDMRLALEAVLEAQPAEQQVFARDIGDMLARSCATQRDERRKQVEREVQRIERGRANAPTPLIPPSAINHDFVVPKDPLLPQTESGVRQATTPGGDRTESEVSRSNTINRKKGVSGWFYAAAAVLVLASVMLILSAKDADPSRGSSEKENQLIVQTTPREASVFLDGRKLGSGRVETSLSSGSTHLLRVTAEGHVPVERTIVSKAASTELDINLKPIEPVAPSAPAVTAASAVAAPELEPLAQEEVRNSPQVRSSPQARPPSKSSVKTPTPTKTTAPTKTTKGAESTNCNPPYYFVDDIKTYKKECI